VQKRSILVKPDNTEETACLCSLKRGMAHLHLNFNFVNQDTDFHFHQSQALPKDQSQTPHDTNHRLFAESLA
jgi:hypothetical protein